MRLSLLRRTLRSMLQRALPSTWVALKVESTLEGFLTISAKFQPVDVVLHSVSTLLASAGQSVIVLSAVQAGEYAFIKVTSHELGASFRGVQCTPTHEQAWRDAVDQATTFPVVVPVSGMLASTEQASTEPVSLTQASEAQPEPTPSPEPVPASEGQPELVATHQERGEDVARRERARRRHRQHA